MLYGVERKGILNSRYPYVEKDAKTNLFCGTLKITQSKLKIKIKSILHTGVSVKSFAQTANILIC